MKIRKQVLFGIASLSLMSACGQAGPVGGPLQPSTTPSQQPSTNPSGEPSSQPTSQPSNQPSGEPSTNPSTSPSGSPGTSPSPSETPKDVSVIEETTFNGDIEDDTGMPLDGVTVQVKSLSAETPYLLSTTSMGGTYVFNHAPAGILLEVSAIKAGYATRKRVVVLKSNKQGDPNANKYDFKSALYALSDKPEVIAVTPARQATNIAANTGFKLVFSEPVDRQTVEDNFVLRVQAPETLSIGATLNTGDTIWSKSAFNLSWNADDTELELSFRDQKQLPTDQDTAKIPEYQIALDLAGGQIKDKSGISRSSNYFKVNAGAAENSSRFTLQADSQKPELTGLTAQTAENGGSNGDAIQVRYSEPMIYYTLSQTLAGGFSAQVSEAAAAHGALSASSIANNYKVTVKRAGVIIVNNQSWGSAGLGGKAVFDTMDPSHKSVLLLPSNPVTNIYEPGDVVTIKLDSTVQDPAGNSMNSSELEVAGTAS